MNVPTVMNLVYKYVRMMRGHFTVNVLKDLFLMLIKFLAEVLCIIISIALIIEWIHFVDLDECVMGTHRCDQECKNTKGSYQCFCQQGYILDGDGVTCQGSIQVKTWNSTLIIFVVFKRSR